MTATEPDLDDLFDAAKTETEPPPKRPKRNRLANAMGWGGRDEAPAQGGEPAPRPPTKERTPSRPARRVDSSDFFERIWAAAGRRIERNIGDVPLGRVLQLTSGATGVVIDDAVKGAIVDKPVQWAVRTEAKLSKVGAVMAAPALVVMIERNPAAAETLAPFLVDALMALGPSMLKAAEKAEKRRQEFAKAMAGLGPAFGLGPDEPVTPEHLLAWIFPPPEDRPQAPQEAAA